MNMIKKIILLGLVTASTPFAYPRGETEVVAAVGNVFYQTGRYAVNNPLNTLTNTAFSYGQ